MNKELVEKYVETYFPFISDEDVKKNEKKKVRNLPAKLSEPGSVYRGLPLEYLSIMEQVRLVHFILEEISEREIISNLSKADVDKNYN